MSAHDSHDHHDDLAPEGDPTPSGVLAVVLFLVLAFMVVSIVAIVPIVRMRTQTLAWGGSLSGPSPELRDQRAWESEELGSYGKNDDGSFRIPVQRAKALLLADPTHLGGVAMAAPAPVSAAGGDAALGQQLHAAKGCIACHSLDGNKGLGPSWQGLFGRTTRLADGTTLTADEDYLRRSMLEPAAQLVEGFAPVMPPMPLTDDEIGGLIALIKSVSTDAPVVDAAAPALTSDAVGAEGAAAEPAPTEGAVQEPEVAGDAAAEPVAEVAPAAEAPAAPAGGDPQVGQQLYTAKGCIACHSLDGNKGLGPSWKGIVGRTTRLADGSSVTADEAYLRKSIVEPTAQVVDGFAPVMPPVPGGLTDAELAGIIAFMKTL